MEYCKEARAIFSAEIRENGVRILDSPFLQKLWESCKNGKHGGVLRWRMGMKLLLGLLEASQSPPLVLSYYTVDYGRTGEFASCVVFPACPERIDRRNRRQIELTSFEMIFFHSFS